MDKYVYSYKHYMLLHGCVCNFCIKQMKDQTDMNKKWNELGYQYKMDFGNILNFFETICANIF